jgi:hypothetical protein
MPDYKFGKNQPPHKRWPIAWYNPRVLLRSAWEMFSTNDQLRNLDRREMYSPDLRLIQVAEEQRDGDFWWDFVSDSGDGGNATYTVAREMQKKSLLRKVQVDVKGKEELPAEFPIGELLILGGDLAYPGANVEEYQYRLTEMWVASNESPRKETGSSELRPSLAIPQNHDWFDNISTFSRYFVDTRADDVGFKIMSAETEPDITPIGTRKLQKQSYFAARLPNNWVILGFDFALVGDIERQQYAAFYKLFNSGQITPEDNLILLYPEPYWSRDLGDYAREGYPKRYQRLEAFILNAGCRIRLRMAGDIHHYARETARAGEHLHYDDMLIISGSGGAFLHPTHTRIADEIKVLNRDVEEGAMTDDLRERVRLGVDSKEICDSSSRRYTEKVFYPRQEDSRNLLWENVWSFFRAAVNIKKQIRDIHKKSDQLGAAISAISQGNVMFSILLASLLVVAMHTKSIIPGAIVVAIFAAISHENNRWLTLVGALAGSLLVAIIESHPYYFVECTVFSKTLHMGGLGEFLWQVVLFLYCFLIAGFFTGVYFSICSWLGFLPNNAFSPLGHEGFKSFIRFRIDKAGNLHGYVWGTDDLPRYWALNPEGKHPVWVDADEDASADWEIKDTFVLNK